MTVNKHESLIQVSIVLRVILNLAVLYVQSPATFDAVEDRKLEIRQLQLLQFKNYETATVLFSPGVNCFLGENGSGKTNLLDAIHYLTACRSYFNPIDSQNIRSGSDTFMIKGDFLLGDREDELHVAVKRNQRKIFRRNHKEYDKLSDHIGLFPSVMISPNDLELILEGSEIRRKFIDSVISQYSRSYLQDLIYYNHALTQRNNLLKSMSNSGKWQEDALEPWDHQLSERATRIFVEREQFITRFTEEFAAIYAQVSGEREVPGLRYNSDLSHSPMRTLLEKTRARDRVLERTSAGIHKDELEFLLGEFPIKRYGSQGQQKTFLIALKLAQFQYIRQSLGVIPVLMLDDIFDKMDEHRTSNLLKMLANGRFGQVFITDTHHERIPGMLNSAGISFTAFEVRAGQVLESKSFQKA